MLYLGVIYVCLLASRPQPSDKGEISGYGLNVNFLETGRDNLSLSAIFKNFSFKFLVYTLDVADVCRLRQHDQPQDAPA